MLDFTTIDMIIVGLILFLSLKGLVNGFTKELFSFIGLIGGVAVAARMNSTVGELISKNIFPVENEPALKLAGFVAVLVAIWLVANMIASIFEKIGGEEVGFLGRILGYAIAILRYTAIFSLIMASVQDVDLISKKIQTHAQKSQVIPQLQELGATLLNMEARQAQNQKSDPIDLDSFKMDQNESNQSHE